MNTMEQSTVIPTWNEEQMIKKSPKGLKVLRNPTDPLSIDRDRSVAGLLEKMESISFQGRNLATAHQLWLSMLSDNCTVFMGLSGALVAAGMRKVVAHLIKNRYIDVLVTTGANMFADLHETLGRQHYIGSPDYDDLELRDMQVERIYDTFGSEVEFREADEWVGSFTNTLDHSRPYSTREFFFLLGRELSEISNEEGILTSAFKAKVPIFCPAIGDSSLGIGIAAARVDRKSQFQFDVVQDIIESAQIVSKSPSTGVIFFGGGSPKNFIQQAGLASVIFKSSVRGHKYGVQCVNEAPYLGGVSGSTFDEAQSWGKMARDAKTITVHCDSTIAMPMLATALTQTATKATKQRRKPNFNQSRDLGISF